METVASLTLDRSQFEDCARRNLEHAATELEVQAITARHNYGKSTDKSQRAMYSRLAVGHENAAATIREILALDGGAYFG